MLTLTELLRLERSLRGRRVLSVYLDGAATDPAQQRVWRVHLNHCLRDLRTWLEGSSHAEREEFEACVRRLEGRLSAFRGNVRGRGWAAFVTADRVHEASVLPVPMPTQAVWSTGMSVAPYVRALKEMRPVVVAVADATKADIYRYVAGEIDLRESARAHHTVMEPSHMGDAPEGGFHSGARGATGHDAAQRSLHEGTRRMVEAAATRMLQLAGPDGWIVTGGIPGVSRRLADQIAAQAPGRVTHVASLDVHASEAAVVEAARAAASELRNAADRARIVDIADHEQRAGIGALGPAATRQALAESRVRDLYISHRYLEEHAGEAEDAVRSAIDQGAAIEEVSGAAAEQLDLHGGLAARMRYPLSPRL